MACTTACVTQDHDTYGACLRAKAIQIDRFALVGDNQSLEKRKNQTLERYRQLVRSGVQPESPTKAGCDAAEKTLSDKTS